jgi:selenocysteine lyase/cysteine desulfurase
MSVASQNRNLIYLDNAATTFPKPECVYDSAEEFYRGFGGNAGRGTNPLARKCAELIIETRSLVADWLGISSPERVIFTSSATFALNLAILGARLRDGDVVYITPFEHNSVLRPLEHLRQTLGIEVRQIPFHPQTFTYQLDRLEAMFRVDPPAMVCVTQASNVCGVMPPVKGILGLSRKVVGKHCVNIVDGAQAAGLYPLNLDQGLVDGLIFSSHKSLYGPYGVAGLVLATEWRPAPLLFGGTGTNSESLEMPDALPSTYEAGSHNIHAIAGLRAALGWLQETGRETIVSHTRNMALQLRDALNEMSGITLYVPDNDELWTGILSFTIDGIRPQAIESMLGAKRIAVRAGLHCAPVTHHWLGTINCGGTIRVSPSFFNPPEDVGMLVDALRSIKQIV